ncbi:MAG: copper amine oxidase N-terminal domain-containing protein [Candidatus Eremiobacteraeota bacterium]|nr:copper amine oxidase N-terminal domain-containing protein [Candidatus Eremiobacteraeota bacterium]
MKRLLWIFLLLGAVGAPQIAGAQSVTVIVNGQPVSFTQPPIVRAGRVFVPLRGVFERLGASVVYASGQINATGRGRNISLTINSTQATVNGQPETIDVAPFLVADTTYVPLRFISQALGASVNWNDSTSTVTINAGGGGSYPPRPPQPPPPGYVVHLVSVSPTGTIYSAHPTISFQFDHRVRLEALRIRVDGNDVTANVSQSGRGFYLNLPWAIQAGPHHVRATGTTIDGVSFDLSWDFVRG